MPKATLTKRLEFCSSHRYHNPNWDDSKNREMFGACNNVNSHGHNYLLEVTLCGEIDPVTGMIINLYDLKQYLWEVLKELDHKNLNLDTPYFAERIPTTENIALTLWHILTKHPDLPALDSIRLYEDETLYAEVRADLINETWALTPALIARRYQFSAIHHTEQGKTHGHQYDVWVALQGPIPSDTGQVINLNQLDSLVQTHLLDRFEQRDLNQDPLLAKHPVTDSFLAQQCWEILAPHFHTPPLHRISVSQQPGALASVSR